VVSFFVGLDGNSVERLAASCARQGFRPQYISTGPILFDRFKSNPNLDGMVGEHQTFPYFQTGTPGTDEFQQALKVLGRGIAPGPGVASGWTAGKLLERAGAALPEPPTTEALLRGLWSIKHDTLGGLTYPLTFAEGATSERKACWFNVAVAKGAWVSPDGYQNHCGV
jgi:branched-chain amino acid transport system substrate-binding protein